MSKIIMRQNTRILTPRDWERMRKHLNAKYMLICDVVLESGMRWEEFWDLLDHPEWFDPSRRCIDLPKSAIKKVKSIYKERTIRLTVDGCDAVKALLRANGSVTYTDRASVGAVLKLAATKSGIGDTGITPKMFRKTLVSWLVVCYPERAFTISASIGHDLETMRIHYANLSFERRDVEDMRKFLQGWGE
jgi:integrase